jgi:adenine-specific DNA-methyltransferase
MVESSNASKVAAWFLDSDYDGQCFCVSQAFFPDSKAWEKIAKALGSKDDEATFEAFAGTTSLPFMLGKHRRVAIKVIDPRGNEVMGIKTIA